MENGKEVSTEMDMDNIVDFKQAKELKFGGKEPPDFSWLGDIEPGTTVIVRKRAYGGQPQEAMCMEYTVVKHREDSKLNTKVTLLYSDLNPPPSFIWVDTKAFSKITELVYISEVKKNVD